jgi:hypothetical protein
MEPEVNAKSVETPEVQMPKGGEIW